MPPTAVAVNMTGSFYFVAHITKPRHVFQDRKVKENIRKHMHKQHWKNERTGSSASTVLMLIRLTSL